MKNMKISTKLLTGFLAVTLLSTVIGVFGILGLNRMGNASEDMYLKKAKPLGDLALSIEYAQLLRVQMRNCILFSGDAAQINQIESSLNEDIQAFETAMAAYEPTMVAPAAKELFADALDQYDNTFKPALLRVLEGAKAGKPQAELMVIMTSVTDSVNQMASDMTQLTDMRLDLMKDSDTANRGLEKKLLWAISGVLAISVAASLLMALYISKLISAPVRAMSESLRILGETGSLTFPPHISDVASETALRRDELGYAATSFQTLMERLQYISMQLSRISAGDLTADIILASDDDLMGQSLKSMTRSLNEMFSEIRVAAAQVSAGSAQIAQSAQNLASGSTEQAASVEEFTAALSTVKEKVEYNAQSAKQSFDVTTHAGILMQDSMSSMSDMLEAMQSIDESSKSIKKIIKVIDDIAFQTNILALNAAVEAARAGLHGKGFAVVAEEVRNLAGKSAEAAKETAGLIEGSSSRVSEGGSIVSRTNESLEAVGKSAQENLGIITKIVQSSDDQARSIRELNEGISQISAVVQANSATAEQSAAAAEEMSAQAARLQDLISRFKLRI